MRLNMREFVLVPSLTLVFNFRALAYILSNLNKVKNPLRPPYQILELDLIVFVFLVELCGIQIISITYIIAMLHFRAKNLKAYMRLWWRFSGGQRSRFLLEVWNCILGCEATIFPRYSHSDGPLGENSRKRSVNFLYTCRKYSIIWISKFVNSNYAYVVLVVGTGLSIQGAI